MNIYVYPGKGTGPLAKSPAFFAILMYLEIFAPVLSSWRCSNLNTYFAESLSLVPTRSVDEQRMKENSVSLLHLHVHPVVVLLVVQDAVVHLVNPSLEHIREGTKTSPSVYQGKQESLNVLQDNSASKLDSQCLFFFLIYRIFPDVCISQVPR